MDQKNYILDIDPSTLPDGVSIVIQKNSSGFAPSPAKPQKKINFKIFLGFLNSLAKKAGTLFPGEELVWIAIFSIVLSGGYFLFSSDLKLTVPNTGITESIAQRFKQENTSLKFPLKGYSRKDVRLTSPIGEPRPLRCTSGCRKHAGNDYAAPNMTAIAMADGHIARPEEALDLGLMLNSQHNSPPSVGHILSLVFEYKGKTYLARYVHLDQPLKQFKPGDKIQKEQELARITKAWAGSSGAHLHLELYKKEGNSWNQVDSEDYF